MAPTGGVDENDIEVVGGGVSDGVFGDVGGILAVSFFVQFYFTKVFTFAELFEIAGVNAELFDGTRSEGVAGGDEKAEVVLEEEEG